MTGKSSISFADIRRQVLRVSAVIGGLILLGTLGYAVLGELTGVPASLLDALYMTVITLASVGYGEVVPVAATEVGRGFSIVLILGGVGVLSYAVSTLAVTLVEGALGGAWEQWRMERRISEMRDHFIICGLGRIGEAIARELVATKRPTLVIDRDPERGATVGKQLDIPTIIGDATDEAILTRAGIEHAIGLLASLDNEHLNLFLVMTARSLNPNMRIVARGSMPSVVDKMRRVGADDVVLPEHIGALRMVSTMVRPAAVSFLDQMLREQGVLRVEEVRLSDGSPLCGRPLRDSEIKSRWSALVLAHRTADGRFAYNPPPESVLEAGMVLVVMGDVDNLAKLRAVAEKNGVE